MTNRQRLQIMLHHETTRRIFNLQPKAHTFELRGVCCEIDAGYCLDLEVIFNNT